MFGSDKEKEATVHGKAETTVRWIVSPFIAAARSTGTKLARTHYLETAWGQAGGIQEEIRHLTITMHAFQSLLDAGPKKGTPPLSQS